MIASAKRLRPKGVILYDGPSLIDGKPIVAIATGLAGKSANGKTGNMVHTWIIRSDIAPFAAIHSGDDYSVCGNCPMRGVLEQITPSMRRKNRKLRGRKTRNRRRACYVRVHQAPGAVYRAYHRGSYVPFDPKRHLRHFAGRMVRGGSYGDPCAVPYSVWAMIFGVADGHTGYTHQHDNPRNWRYRRLFMASCETPEQADNARARGWRTFRTTMSGSTPERGEFSCPASAEQGHRLTCEQCAVCNGAMNRPNRASVTIWAHGGPAAVGSYKRTMLPVLG